MKKMRDMETIGVIGVGRVGAALACILKECGYQVTVVTRKKLEGDTIVINKNKIKAVALELMCNEADIIFITTPDGIIGETVKKLMKYKLTGKCIFHMSGSLGSNVLSPLKKREAFIGSLHPLQSFATVEQAIDNLPGSYFTYEGDMDVIGEVEQLVKKLRGTLKILDSPDIKSLYHVGACLVSNYLIALAKLGTECLCTAGFDEQEAKEALLPLMQGTLNNIAKNSLAQALTGPVSRGDLQVVENHVRILSKELPHIERAYCELTPILAEIALEKGDISEKDCKEILRITG